MTDIHQKAREAYEASSRAGGGHLTSLDAAVDAALGLRRSLRSVCDAFEETLEVNKITNIVGALENGAAWGVWIKSGAKFEGETLYEAISEVADERSDDAGEEASHAG